MKPNTVPCFISSVTVRASAAGGLKPGETVQPRPQVSARLRAGAPLAVRSQSGNHSSPKGRHSHITDRV
jgi:hypothetical protein